MKAMLNRIDLALGAMTVQPPMGWWWLGERALKWQTRLLEWRKSLFPPQYVPPYTPDRGTYTVVFNEYQRRLLIRMATAVIEADALVGPGDVEATAMEEVRALQDMLVALPAEEAVEPGVIHGFCL